MSGARERIRRVTGSLYWRQFMLTAGMVLLTLALLGVSFYALSYNYTLSEKRQEMRDRAVLVAQLSVDYFTAGEDAERDQEDALRSLAGVASRMTDVDFLICDTDGNVMLTTDGDLAGQTITVPADITGAVLGGDRLYEGRSTVGVYEKRQFVVGVPMTDAEGATLGLVLAVMNSAELTQMWRSFIALFFMSSAIILVLAFITSFVTAMRQIQPLSEMVKATRAYAAGDFDVRMQETGDCSEISELAASFNAMADSLQETERQRRDFIANVSHELKTPMTTIAGYTDGILDGTIPPEKERQYLQIISDESRRLSRLVRRMLDISQIQNQEMRKEEFDLCESAAHRPAVHGEEDHGQGTGCGRGDTGGLRDGAGRPGSHHAGHLQPAGKRRQVRHPRLPAVPGADGQRREGLCHRPQRGRHHPGGGDTPAVRALPQVGQVPQRGQGRLRTGTVHRQDHSGAA